MNRAVFLIMLSATSLISGCGGIPKTPSNPVTGYQIVHGNDATLGSLAHASSAAACPTGKIAVGGGFATGDEAANVYDSLPLAGGTGWTVMAKNENVIGSGINLRGIAICINRPAEYQPVNGSVMLRHLERNSASARCPDGTYRLVGGGFATRDAMVRVFSQEVEEGRSDRAWIAGFKSHYPSLLPSSSRADASGICLKIPDVDGWEVIMGPEIAIGIRSNSSLQVACPPGKKVLSGGVRAAEGVAVTYDSQPMPAGSGWMASVHNPQTIIDPVTVHAQVFAVCANVR